MIKVFRYFGELVDFLTVFFPQPFHGEKLFIEFSDLNLIILCVEELALLFFVLDAENLNLTGQSLYLNGLEDNYELDVIS